MAHEKEIVTCLGDENFRKGACHGAHWFLETSQTLAQQGRTCGEVSAHLADLAAVLAAWRNQTGDLPDGNPWDWSFKDLAAVIKARKDA